jgi:DNA-directed RNA polymerase specialized sigma24 family protein
MTDTERSLWRRWTERRDEAAFAALVAAHERFVFDFARRLAGHAADAEDLAQQAFLDLAECRGDRPVEVGLRPFLGRRLVLGARTLRRASLGRTRRHGRAAVPDVATELLGRLEQGEGGDARGGFGAESLTKPR